MSSAARKTSSDDGNAGAPGTAELFGTCPLPRSQYDHIVLGHGSGGWLTAELIQRLFVPAFGNEILARLEDSATVRLQGNDGVAAHGTVNDLAVAGAEPLFLSAAFILEEGLALSDLKRIVDSMRAACAEANVTLVTGDTKVVDRGK